MRLNFQHKHGPLLKPYQTPPKGDRESEFYRKINAMEDETDIEFKKWIPNYFGIKEIGKLKI